MSVSGYLLILGVLAPLLAATVWSGRGMRKEMVGVLIFIGMLAIRPGLLGEIAGPIGGCLLLAVLYLVLLDGRAGGVTISGKQGWALSMCVLAPIVLGGLRGAEALSGVLISPVVAAVGLLISREQRILKGLSGATALVAAQQSLGLMVSKLLSFGFTTFIPTGVSRHGWEYSVSGLGSISVGSGGVYKIFDQRLTGPYGEPGVFAAVLAITGLLDLVSSRSWRWRIQIPIACAILLTQSIAGIGTYALGLLLYLVLDVLNMKIRRFGFFQYLGILGALFASLAAATTRNGFLAGKQAANASSVSDRLGGATPAELIATWLSHPLGIHSNSSINLVQSSIAYGPLLLVFGLWLYGAPLRGRNPMLVAPVVAAVLATVVFAQPPFLYSWIFFAFAASGMSVRLDLRPAAQRPAPLSTLASR